MDGSFLKGFLSKFDDFDINSFIAAFCTILILVSLGIWKAVEIVIWIFNHLSVNWK